MFVHSIRINSQKINKNISQWLGKIYLADKTYKVYL